MLNSSSAGPQNDMGEIASPIRTGGECIHVAPANFSLQLVAKQLQSYEPTTQPSAEGEADRPMNLHQTVNASSTDADQAKERRAAVLICLFEGDEGELRVLLTKRSYNLSTHPGEVALPGGKMEESDRDETATALRESMEEIGLDPTLVHVVALLEPFVSQRLLKVTPVVGVLADRAAFKPLLNPAEVIAVFDVPLQIFLKEENHRIEEKEWMGSKYYVHFFDFECDDGKKFLIWGLTAGILIRAASLIYQRPPQYRQPSPDFQELQRSLTNQRWKEVTPSMIP